MRQALRILGTLVAGAGILGLLWVLTVWQWQDPFTALYATYQQHRLAASYDRIEGAYVPLVQPQPSVEGGTSSGGTIRIRRLIAREAKRYRHTLEEGEPLGRLEIPRLGLSSIVVTGTQSSSLTKGPGWYRGTFLPGERQLIYIAGHRTTYLAPFAHIDSLRAGDRVILELPYGTFVYSVTGHEIVPADDIARLRSRGREVVALQACHPRFFATHRYIVYARPVRVIPRHGRPYTVGRAVRAADA